MGMIQQQSSACINVRSPTNHSKQGLMMTPPHNRGRNNQERGKFNAFRPTQRAIVVLGHVI
jgi:hypothetical protein